MGQSNASKQPLFLAVLLFDAEERIYFTDVARLWDCKDTFEVMMEIGVALTSIGIPNVRTQTNELCSIFVTVPRKFRAAAARKAKVNLGMPNSASLSELRMRILKAISSRLLGIDGLDEISSFVRLLYNCHLWGLQRILSTVLAKFEPFYFQIYEDCRLLPIDANDRHDTEAMLLVVQHQDPFLAQFIYQYDKNSAYSLSAYRIPEMEKIKDRRGNTALHWAAKSGELALVQLFYGICPEAAAVQNDCREIPLHTVLNIDSFSQSCSDVAKFLSRKNPETLKIKDCEGYTALHMAVVQGNFGLVQALHELCPEAAAAQTNLGETPLHLAVDLSASSASCNLELISFLSHGNPETLKIKDNKGFTVLHVAVISGNLNIVKDLYELCPEAAAVQDKEGKIPLHLAVRDSETDISLFLSRRKPETLSIQECYGNTTLHEVLAIGMNVDLFMDLCKLYPEAAAVQNRTGETVLHLALTTGDIYDISWDTLIELVSLVPRRNREVLKLKEASTGDTILHKAVHADREIAEFVYELYPDAASLTNEIGETPLMGYMDEFDADLLTYDREGDTVADGVLTPTSMRRHMLNLVEQ